jgi:hypothetical protein
MGSKSELCNLPDRSAFPGFAESLFRQPVAANLDVADLMDRCQ